MKDLSSHARSVCAAVFPALRGYLFASLLFIVAVSPSEAQDAPSNPIPDSLKDIIIVDPSQPHEQTFTKESVHGDIRGRVVARPDPGSRYHGHFNYMMRWQQGATTPLPVAIVFSSLPEAQKVDFDLWRGEIIAKRDMSVGQGDDFVHRGYLAIMAFSSIKNDLAISSGEKCQPQYTAATIERGADEMQ